MAHYVPVVERLRGHVSPEELAALAASHPDPLSPQARAAAEAKADHLAHSYAGPSPFSFQQTIDDIERALAKGPASGLEPETPEFWRDVVEVLHERQWRAFDADRGGAETPWDALDSEDFAYEVEAAKDLPKDDPYRQSLEMEIARQRAAAQGLMALFQAPTRGEGPANDAGINDLAVQSEVDALVAEFSEPGQAFDYNRHAEATEIEIARHRTQQHLDPPDPAFWRAVVAELRRRADDAAAAA